MHHRWETAEGDQPSSTVEIEVNLGWGDTKPIDSSLLLEGIHKETTLNTPTVSVRDENEDVWTEAEQKRFEDLAVAEAVGELTDDEGLELEVLSQTRRTVQSPRSGDEVLWEYEQRQLTGQLVATLSKYVDFYKGPNPAWTRAQKDSDG